MSEREPLMLIPGMMCDGRLWGPQLEGLADVAEMQVADITAEPAIGTLGASVLEQAPWPRFSVAGLSMGGIVAMELMRQAPERIARLALLDTNHRAEVNERQRLRDHEIERVLSGELMDVVIQEMKPLYLAAQSRLRTDLLPMILQMALDLGPEVFARQSMALQQRPDSTGTLRGVRCPTLVVCGAEDVLCPVARHEEMAGLIPGAVLRVVAGAGHMSALEQPAAVNEALRAWLAKPAAA